MTTDIAERFLTIAVVDTNGLLRGQKVAASELPGILSSGMGMSPAQRAPAGESVLRRFKPRERPR